LFLLNKNLIYLFFKMNIFFYFHNKNMRKSPKFKRLKDSFTLKKKNEYVKIQVCSRRMHGEIEI
jgi:hypothetical protein